MWMIKQKDVSRRKFSQGLAGLLLCVVASIVSFVVCADVVKGRVCLIPFPSIEEFAQAYDTAKSADIKQVASELVTAKFNAKGVVDVANIAVVELQSLPEFKVLKKTTVGDKAEYIMQIGKGGPDCRVFCRYEYGGNVFSGSSHIEWNESEKAFCQDIVLRGDYVSVAGRCMCANGVPLSNAVVEVVLVTTPVEQEERFYKTHIARSDKNGCWRVDGVNKPSFLRLLSYVCNTNVARHYDSSVPPYRISVGAYPKYGDYKITGCASVANVSASDRVAVERIKAAIKRKTGKDIQCPAPLTDFPVSTNNVIYVPDIVLK